MNDNEQWKPVPGYEGLYEVSSAGHVRSLTRHGYRNRRGGVCAGIALERFTDNTGYWYVNLSRGGKARKRAVHIMVLEAFVGAAPDGMEACHGDGDRKNAALFNLRWDTRKANAADKEIHGTVPRGERSPRAKITEAIAREILASTETSVALGRRIGIASSTVRAVRLGQNWKHLRQHLVLAA
ncbi:hypothetical protein F1_00027 [Ralstonia phage Heva]|uniref:HNH nuclease domain-containing protein n=1 Tax=Ralstonia phage Heva TaxID=2759730 RepID=A0A7G5BAR7_9CAUD|nr:HNH endonuclease [Ralstonia phage Heva]QMV33390.1 hypothetical protein F1_00027 [Ralstonia phage Heva]